MESENINPWVHIWTRPKRTMRAILERDPKRWVLWLAIIGGMLSTLAWMGYLWIEYAQRPTNFKIGLMAGALVGGAIGGVIHLYVGGWLYKLTGSWIGGEGSFTGVKCAVGWSYYPLIPSYIIGALSLLAVPNPWLQGILGILNLVLLVWALVIFFNLVGEAHRFSAWKALLAVIIAMLLVAVVVMIIALITPLLTPLFE